MAPRHIGFGIEIEMDAIPRQYLVPHEASRYRYYAQLAYELTHKYNQPAHSATTAQKYPSDYRQWWITNDSSISAPFNHVQMECVSPVIDSAGNWQVTIRDFWRAVRSLFTPQINFKAGTHVHTAPWQKRFTLDQAKTLAFACCYYEPYVVSCLPMNRRDNRYAMRNTNKAGRMGALYRRKAPAAIGLIAQDMKSLPNMAAVVTYVQGGLQTQDRYVLWNFQNLVKKSGTIEFRGGRHVRGPVRTKWWITFVVVFILFALYEDRLHKQSSFRVPHNDREAEVQNFYKKLRVFASKKLGLRGVLPPHFKNLSEKKPYRQ